VYPTIQLRFFYYLAIHSCTRINKRSRGLHGACTRECCLSVVSLPHDILNSLCLMFLHFFLLFSCFSYFFAGLFFFLAQPASRKHKEVARSTNKKSINGRKRSPEYCAAQWCWWSFMMSPAGVCPPPIQSSFPSLRDLIVRIFMFSRLAFFILLATPKHAQPKAYTRRAGFRAAKTTRQKTSLGEAKRAERRRKNV
jgi:hypothetical protein